MRRDDCCFSVRVQNRHRWREEGLVFWGVRFVSRLTPENPSIGRVTRRMLDLLSSAERRRLWLLTPVVTLNALVQVIGIASVMPFLALIANPGIVQEQALLRWVYDTFGFTSITAFLIFTGLVVLGALVASNGFAALTQLLMLRFAWDMNHTLSVRMLRTYLGKPYVFFLGQNSSSLAKNILGEVRRTVQGVMVAGINLIARAVVAVAVLALLVVVDPLLAAGTFFALGAAYGVFFLRVRRGLAFAGERRVSADRHRYRAATEALTGFKEIKVLGMEQPFLERFERPSRAFARYEVRHEVIRMLPRYAFETIAFGGMLLIVLFALARDQGLTALLPTLGVYAFAAYRLMPALQGVFGSMAELRFSIASVETLHADLEGSVGDDLFRHEGVQPIPFTERLELRNVTFAYPGAQQPLLEGFNLTIEANTSVALVGSTGAGKTTVVDLLLGLLRPQIGNLVVDCTVVDDETVPAWQRNIGYVPQTIYLSDDSVAANIAFGVPKDRIDMEAVRRSARQAQIHDFIVKELPDAYGTGVGERGIRLSGGQRQRLGIARALYRNPDVLVFDEATSALDNVTEEEFFQAVRDIGRSKTIVMIAHRISTVRDCDVIVMLDAGQVVARGGYEQLLATSAPFRNLARVGRPEQVKVS